MKTLSLGLMVVILGGCFHSTLEADRSAVSKLASADMACGSNKANVVFYALRGGDNAANTPCFGDKAEAMAVVECGGNKKAYWRGKAAAWEARPGTVTSADANVVEISLMNAENTSGAVDAVARCTH